MAEKRDYLEIKIASITPRPHTLKSHNKESRKLLSNSLSKYGQTRPVIVRSMNESFEVIDGNELIESAKKLGWDKIYCLNLGEISDIEASKIYLSLNIDHYDKDFLVFSELVSDLIEKGLSLNHLANVLSMKIESVEQLKKLLDFDWEGSFDDEIKTNDQLGLF